MPILPKCLLSECEPRIVEQPSERIPDIIDYTVVCLTCGATCGYAVPKQPDSLDPPPRPIVAEACADELAPFPEPADDPIARVT